MFGLPPLPPKDYVLREVTHNQKSCPDFTPLSLPRTTQTSVALFCSPIDYQRHDKLDHIVQPPVSPQILDMHSRKARAFWQDRPGKNDYHLHRIYGRYSVKVEDSYDSRFRHKEAVFYRPYKYEMDCMRDAQLHKLRLKVGHELGEEEGRMRDYEERRARAQENKLVNDMGLTACEEPPPFWWRADVPEKVVEERVAKAGAVELDPDAYKVKFSRWQDEPEVLKFALADPCMRRENMALIYQPYRSEACNWYYENFPQPILRRLFKRFV